MSCGGGRPAFPETVAEVHVAGLGNPRMADAAGTDETADLLQRPGEAGRIAGELHRRGVGEILALA